MISLKGIRKASCSLLLILFITGCSSASSTKTMEVKDIITNLADAKPRYAKVSLMLEYEANGEVELESYRTQIRDALLTVLRGKMSDAVQGAGTEELRQECLQAVNNALGKDCVAGAYFTEFIVQ